jgi:O-antigen/teichoic acid export membrane protein
VARGIGISFDVVLIKILRPDTEAGQYALASRLVLLALIYVNLYYQAFLPSLIQALERGRSDLRAVVRLATRRAIVVGVPLAVLGTLAAPSVVRRVFGSAYSPAAGFLQVLIWSLFAFGLVGVFHFTLIALGLFGQAARNVVISVGVNVVLNLALVPTVGASGAAVAAVVSEATVLVLGYLCVRRHLGPRVEPGDLDV